MRAQNTVRIVSLSRSTGLSDCLVLLKYVFVEAHHLACRTIAAHYLSKSCIDLHIHWCRIHRAPLHNRILPKFPRRIGQILGRYRSQHILVSRLHIYLRRPNNCKSLWKSSEKHRRLARLCHWPSINRQHQHHSIRDLQCCITTAIGARSLFWKTSYSMHRL